MLKYTNEKITMGYLLIMLFIFPLFFHDKYADITKAKAIFFISVTLFFFFVCLILSFIYKEKKFLFFYDKTNWFYLFFMLCAAISSILSSDLNLSFTGEDGRYNGLLILIVYFLVGILIYQFSNFSKILYTVFLISGSIVCILGILNHYYIDPLHFYTNIDGQFRSQYISTIGHINFFSSFVSFLLPFFALPFCFSQKRMERIISYMGFVITIGAIIVGSSVSGYIALFALVMALPFFLIKKYIYLMRFSLLGIGIIGAFLIITYFDSLVDSVMPIEEITYIFTNNQTALITILICLFFLTALFYHFSKENKEISKKQIKFLQRLFGCTLLICIVGVILAVIIENFNADTGLLKLTDDWGNGRGYVWKHSLEIYINSTFIQKLFGFGPGMFGNVYYSVFGDAQLNYFNVYYDNIHNEYLQYLFTHGIFGLALYLIWFIGSIYKIIRNAHENYYLLAIGIALISYGAQAIININMISVMGIVILWIFIGKKTIMNNTKEIVYYGEIN